MPALPDYLEELPRIEQIARWLDLSEDVLLGHLRNQLIYANHGDRIHPDHVFWALEREMAAGRPFKPERLTPV